MALVCMFDTDYGAQIPRFPMRKRGRGLLVCFVLFVKPSNYAIIFLYIPAAEDDEEEDNIKHHTNRRIKRTEDQLKIGEEYTKEEIAEKYELLQEAFDDLKGWNLEFFISCRMFA